MEKKEKDKSQIVGGDRGGRERGVQEIFYFFIIFSLFFLFVFFSDLLKLDRRFSSGLKAKLIYAMRATHGHQNLGVLSNCTR